MISWNSAKVGAVFLSLTKPKLIFLDDHDPGVGGVAQGGTVAVGVGIIDVGVSVGCIVGTGVNVFVGLGGLVGLGVLVDIFGG